MYFLSKFISFTTILSLVCSQIPRTRMYHGGFGEGNYSFGYQVSEPSGAIKFRQEAGDSNGNRQGSYGLSESDKTRIVVNYSTKPRSTIYHENHPLTTLARPDPVIGDNLDNDQLVENGKVYTKSGSSSAVDEDGDRYSDNYDDDTDSDQSNLHEIVPKRSPVWRSNWERQGNEYNHQHQEISQQKRDNTPTELDRASYDRLVNYVIKSHRNH